MTKLNIFLSYLSLISGAYARLYSYDDVFSQPEYVLVKEPLINDSQLKQHIDSIDKEKFTYQYMRLENSSYLCTIPKVPFDKHSINELKYPPGIDNTNYKPTEDEQSALKKGIKKYSENELKVAKQAAIEALSRLSSSCMYYRWGWWTYSLCYGKEILQFHQSDPGIDKTKAPKPDEGSTVYTLGKFDHILDTNTLSTQKYVISPKSIDIRIDTSGDTPYLVYHLKMGTMCELTSSERTIDLQFFCSRSSPQTSISWTEELRSCHYQMGVHTPLLCDIPLFVPPERLPANKIGCRRILSEVQASSGTYKVEEDPLVLMEDQTALASSENEADDLKLKLKISDSDIYKIGAAISSQLGLKSDQDWALIFQLENMNKNKPDSDKKAEDDDAVDETRQSKPFLLRDHPNETLTILIVLLKEHFQNGGYLIGQDNLRGFANTEFTAYIELHDLDEEKTPIYIRVTNKKDGNESLNADLVDKYEALGINRPPPEENDKRATDENKSEEQESESESSSESDSGDDDDDSSDGETDPETNETVYVTSSVTVTSTSTADKPSEKEEDTSPSTQDAENSQDTTSPIQDSEDSQDTSSPTPEKSEVTVSVIPESTESSVESPTQESSSAQTVESFASQEPNSSESETVESEHNSKRKDEL